ncbi:ATP-binding cassette domain-containing protein [Amycolatopsis sp. K13G38]|uniref:ATP-binding cassette domain-containing protein n=2 Tax=Amycolatopsis acididurans TaxID=2724524 RepID=A0ABX1J8G9_9PSEU|nr:ATP-binding cassette domain-containing protein [Amycolatopsis acididurans]
MLEMRAVRLVYNEGTTTEVVAVAGLDITIPSGQFVTVVGSNGAGKSSFIQLVSGAVRPTTGRVVIAGTDVTRQPQHRRAGRIGRVFDNPHAGSVPELSIEENLALAMARGRRRGLRLATTRQRREQMRAPLANLGLGLENRLHDPVRLLSAGQRQSLTMVMASLTSPEVLLLDEHLAALDPGTASRVLDLTVGLVRRLACTTIMVTHNMEHAITVGDRLLVMSRGRVIADFDAEEKARLTVPELVGHITGAGDVVSDRMLLEESA